MNRQDFVEGKEFWDVINAPSDWNVVDEGGRVIDPGDQDFGHEEPGRYVRLSEGGPVIGRGIMDYAFPADKAPDLPRPKNLNETFKRL